MIPPAAPDLGFHQTLGPPPITTSYRSLSGHTPASMIDGNPATPWSSAAGGITFPGDITIDYGQQVNIGKVTVHTGWARGQAITNLDLQTWDGTQWVTQVAGKSLTWAYNNAAVESQTVTLPAVVSTRKLRIIVNRANLQWVNFAVYEIVRGV